MEINFNNPKSYLTQIGNFVENIIGSSIHNIVNSFNQSTYLHDFINEVVLVDYDYAFHKKNKIAFLSNNFDSIIGYHATKQPDINKIFNEGLKLLSFEEYLEISISCFDKYASKCEIQEIILKSKDRIDKMEINLYSLKEFQFDHFLIYGSETLLGIANSINPECRNILRNKGIPVVYECKVPVSYIAPNDICEIFDVMLYNFLLSKSNKKAEFQKGVNFLLARNHLDKCYIKNNYIPTYEMFDQFEKAIYRYDNENGQHILTKC